MASQLIEAIIAVIAAPFIAVGGWIFVKLEDHNDRLSVLETKDEGLEKLINSRFDDVERRLARIEKKQDKD